MTELKTPLDVYKVLPQTNCGRCFLPSCLAFAAAVIRGDKRLADCPPLEGSGLGELQTGRLELREEELRDKTAQLQQQIQGLDLAAAAPRVGGTFRDQRLLVQVLGKAYAVDALGHVSSDCHTHPGLVIPLLEHIIEAKDQPPMGRWLAFRELGGEASAMSPLFARRGEATLRRLADSQPEFFDDLVSIFSGERIDGHLDSDVALVLYPLPRLPVLICYWQPEDGLESRLQIFFDQSADRQLGIRSIYSLAVGLVMMFEKIAHRHL